MSHSWFGPCEERSTGVERGRCTQNGLHKCERALCWACVRAFTWWINNSSQSLTAFLHLRKKTKNLEWQDDNIPSTSASSEYHTRSHYSCAEFYWTIVTRALMASVCLVSYKKTVLYLLRFTRLIIYYYLRNPQQFLCDSQCKHKTYSHDILSTITLTTKNKLLTASFNSQYS